MRHSTTTVVMGNSKLLLQSWLIDDPVANVIIVHGLGEHSSRYGWTASKFAEAGCNVFTYDQRGHGKSSGRRAYIQTFDELVADFIAVQKEIDLDQSLPLFVYAHSMGALMVGKYIVDHQPKHVRGVICSGGAFKVDPDLSPFLQRIAPVMGRLMPLLKTVKLDPALVSRDAEEVMVYRTDTLVNHEGTYARTGWQMLSTIQYVQSNAARWSLPTLLMHGGADKLIDPAGSRYMYEHMSSTDKELIILDGLYHEIMREPEKEDVLSTMTSWLVGRL